MRQEVMIIIQLKEARWHIGDRDCGEIESNCM